MKFALETLNNIRTGTRDRKIHAAFTFALWFAAMGFVLSALGEYIAPLSNILANVIGALALAGIVATIKLS